MFRKDGFLGRNDIAQHIPSELDQQRSFLRALIKVSDAARVHADRIPNALLPWLASILQDDNMNAANIIADWAVASFTTENPEIASWSPDLDLSGAFLRANAWRQKSLGWEVSPFQWDLPPWAKPNGLAGDYAFEFIDNDVSLRAAAVNLNNCLRSYRKDAAEGRCALYEIRLHPKKRKLVGAVELQKHGSGFRLVQASAWANQKLSQACLKRLDEWLGRSS